MESEPEPAINWAQDTYGRRGQIERQFWAAESSVQGYVSSLQSKSAAISLLDTGNHQQVADAASRAYQGLEDVVAQLLKVDIGYRSLSRGDTGLVATLKAVAERFQSLEDVSEENNKELGVKAGDCKELGDAAGRLMKALEQRAQGLNSDAVAVWVQRDSTRTVWEGYRNAEGGLQDRVNKFRDEAESFGNSVATFVGGGDEARTNLKNEEDRLNTNRERQRYHADLEKQYEQLSNLAKNASAAYMGLKKELETQKKGFDDEYNKVTQARAVESKLWSGLLDLRNTINTTEVRSTRDRSLHEILKLLKMDDTVFMRQKFYEDAETRINKAIQEKLGSNKLTRLIAGIYDEPKEVAGVMDTI